jgi:ATP-dependent Lon protease
MSKNVVAQAFGTNSGRGSILEVTLGVALLGLAGCTSGRAFGNNRVEGEIGLGFFIAAFSALKKAPPSAAMLVLGDLSVQGNIKGLRSLVEPLQLAMDNGAKRALIPIENKRSFLEVTGDVVEHVDPIFFGDPKTAAFKALGLN